MSGSCAAFLSCNFVCLCFLGCANSVRGADDHASSTSGGDDDATSDADTSTVVPPSCPGADRRYGLDATPATGEGGSAQPDYSVVEAPAPWNYAPTYPSRASCASGEGKTYGVGPGQPYPNPRDVPWQQLLPCDIVDIHYSDHPYSDILYISSRGRVGKYITIRGVPGPNGEKPTFDGSSAVMPTNQNHLDVFDGVGMLIVGPSTVSRAVTHFYKPGYLHITGIKFQNVRAPGSVRLASGATLQWTSFPPAIYISPGEHIAVTNCELADNGVGLFVNSPAGYSNENEAWQSRDILIAHNHFHGNGVADYSAGKHNLYAEAIGITYEYNFFDSPLIAQSGSDNVKDRSAGTIFRYNYVRDGVNLLSLRDPQSGQWLESQARDAWDADANAMAFVYSNIFLISSLNSYDLPEQMIVYGDGAPTASGPGGYPCVNKDGSFIGSVSCQVRYGTLYFYNNRVVSKLDANLIYGGLTTPLFEMANTRSPAQVVARNNLFYAASASSGETPAPFGLFYYQGRADWAQNWTNLFVDTASSSGPGVPFDGSGLGGLSESADDPGFVDSAHNNFLTTAESPYENLQATLPTDVTLRGLVPCSEPVISP